MIESRAKFRFSYENSGPTYRDDTCFADAIELMKRFNIWAEAPESVREYMRKGEKDMSMEPPREVLPRVRNYLIGSNLSALEAARVLARDAGSTLSRIPLSSPA